MALVVDGTISNHSLLIFAMLQTPFCTEYFMNSKMKRLSSIKSAAVKRFGYLNVYHGS